MTYSRKVNYYETDKMGFVHHSNYIKFLEEARSEFFDEVRLPYAKTEEMGIISPVVSINVEYKKPLTYGDEFEVQLKMNTYNGVKFNFEYTVLNKKTGDECAKGSSVHCFLKNGRVISLKRENLQMHEKMTACINI